MPFCELANTSSVSREFQIRFWRVSCCTRSWVCRVSITAEAVPGICSLTDVSGALLSRSRK